MSRLHVLFFAVVAVALLIPDVTSLPPDFFRVGLIKCCFFSLAPPNNNIILNFVVLYSSEGVSDQLEMTFGESRPQITIL